jgi:Arc/MetJ family transcription regulator
LTADRFGRVYRVRLQDLECFVDEARLGTRQNDPQTGGREFAPYIHQRSCIYVGMAKHLVDIDEHALREARTRLGTETIKDTVNEALLRAGGTRTRTVKRSLDLLGRANLEHREDAWR